MYGPHMSYFVNSLEKNAQAGPCESYDKIVGFFGELQVMQCKIL